MTRLLRDAIGLDIARLAAIPAPTEIHVHACTHCPSIRFPSTRDPEMQDIFAADRATQVESAFACAWRREKLCKGYCDLLDIKPHEIKR